MGWVLCARWRVAGGLRHAQTESGWHCGQPAEMVVHQAATSVLSSAVGQRSRPYTFTGVTGPVELEAQNLRVCGLRPRCHAAQAVSTVCRVSSASATNIGGGFFPRGLLGLRDRPGSEVIWVSPVRAVA